jgi:hypothetical protein
LRRSFCSSLNGRFRYAHSRQLPKVERVLRTRLLSSQPDRVRRTRATQSPHRKLDWQGIVW